MANTINFVSGFLYNGPYSLPFIVDPTEDELCNLPLLSPIVTTTISDVTTVILKCMINVYTLFQ